jgi:hypothetical protein
MLTLALAVSIAAAAPGTPRPEFVIYKPNMEMPDVPVIFPSEFDERSLLRKHRYEYYGLAPLEQYTHIMRYSVSWTPGHTRPSKPWIGTYIIQVALAGDESRAQVLLLESEQTPGPAGKSRVIRSIGWITAAAFSELRQKVLRDAAALPGIESELDAYRTSNTHGTQTRLELHSGGPAQIDLTREGDSNLPASTYAAGEHLIAEAERALGRTILRP